MTSRRTRNNRAQPHRLKPGWTLFPSQRMLRNLSFLFPVTASLSHVQKRSIVLTKVKFSSVPSVTSTWSTNSIRACLIMLSSCQSRRFSEWAHTFGLKRALFILNPTNILEFIIKIDPFFQENSCFQVYKLKYCFILILLKKP